MTYSYKMLSMPGANCHVEFTTNNFNSLTAITLVSYHTPILKLELGFDASDGVLAILYPVNCSVSTARHVNRFTTELFGVNRYHELKSLGKGATVICPDCVMDAVNMFEHYVNVGKRCH